MPEKTKLNRRPKAHHHLGKPVSPLRLKLHTFIFEADTPAGKWFDVMLIFSILLSITAVMLESVEDIRSVYGRQLYILEWGFTLLFTAEYIARLLAVGRPWRYVFSLLGVIDLLSILPTYLSLFLGGAQSMLVIRALRLLRIFRVFKLGRFLSEANVLADAIRLSGPKITVFVGTVLSLVVILGTAMYLIEGAENGFTSIPRSMYWAIVTMTTVGYGDIAPQTIPGQVLASVVMLMGYAIIAVPTGIVSAELVQAAREQVSTQACPECAHEGHDLNAVHCKFCGAALHPDTQQVAP